MKIKITFILSMLLAIPVLAIDPPLPGFAASTTNIGTLSSAIISARSSNGGAPRVTTLSVGSDKLASKVQFYKVLTEVQASHTNATTVLPVNSTNTLSATIIVRHLVNDVYEKRTVSGFGSTNLTVSAAPLQETVPGDIIYGVTSTGVGSIAWGASTNTLTSAGGLYFGQPNKPLLLEIDATGAAAGTLFVVSGDYVTGN